MYVQRGKPENLEENPVMMPEVSYDATYLDLSPLVVQH